MNLETEFLNFFLWFRDNGEKHIGKSVEELINTYLNETQRTKEAQKVHNKENQKGAKE